MRRKHQIDPLLSICAPRPWPPSYPLCCPSCQALMSLLLLSAFRDAYLEPPSPIAHLAGRGASDRTYFPCSDRQDLVAASAWKPVNVTSKMRPTIASFVMTTLNDHVPSTNTPQLIRLQQKGVHLKSSDCRVVITTFLISCECPSILRPGSLWSKHAITKSGIGTRIVYTHQRL